MSSAKILIVAPLVLTAASAQTPPAGPKQLLAYIDRNGPQKVVKELTAGDESRWNRLIRNIDTGSPAWLEVAKKIRPATDGGGTQDLEISLAIALAHNPTGVLLLVPETITLEHACRVPFIESDEKTDAAHIRRVRAALRTVTTPGLASKKAECLKIIDADAARLSPKH